MRAVVDRSDPHSFALEVSKHLCSKSLELLGCVEASGYASLIRDDDQHEACSLQVAHGRDRAINKDEVFPTMNVAGVQVDYTIPIEKCT